MKLLYRVTDFILIILQVSEKVRKWLKDFKFSRPVPFSQHFPKRFVNSNWKPHLSFRRRECGSRCLLKTRYSILLLQRQPILSHVKIHPMGSQNHLHSNLNFHTWTNKLLSWTTTHLMRAFKIISRKNKFIPRAAKLTSTH